MNHRAGSLLGFAVLLVFCFQATIGNECYLSPRDAPAITAGDDELSLLLIKLYDRVHIDCSEIRIEGPSQEDQDKVFKRLIEIAGESKESRSRVIHRLIKEMENPDARRGIIACPFINAVRVLGQLKAVEAIDTLVRNMEFTCMNGFVMSGTFNPTHYVLVMMGDAAIPRLAQEVLSDHDSSSRTEAAWVLSEIGGNHRPESLLSERSTPSGMRQFNKNFSRL